MEKCSSGTFGKSIRSSVSSSFGSRKTFPGPQSANFLEVTISSSWNVSTCALISSFSASDGVVGVAVVELEGVDLVDVVDGAGSVVVVVVSGAGTGSGFSVEPHATRVAA